MGSRKRNSAEKIKESKKDLAFAKLNNCPTSPRKMRLVADQIRGEDISSALSILKFSPKEASKRLEKRRQEYLKTYSKSHTKTLVTLMWLLRENIAKTRKML